ncbi:MAG: hypothetical protein K2X45_19425 [Phreatobacter sp.]|jgi:hypothetical protein|nr:hypothetical protein [Phreatobacter sp.]
MTIDWKKVPRQALIDAMRAINLGPSNLSQQRKADLMKVVEFHMRNWPEGKQDQFVILLNLEIAAFHRRAAKKAAEVAVHQRLADAPHGETHEH